MESDYVLKDDHHLSSYQEGLVKISKVFACRILKSNFIAMEEKIKIILIYSMPRSNLQIPTDLVHMRNNKDKKSKI